MNTIVPVYILSGFLGSGKTTLLTKVLDYAKENGKKPAVIMNEIGDVNLDGMLVNTDVPMAELLNGCICCTIRGDLGLSLRELLEENNPDVIYIESSGIANPLETIEGVTDASLIARVELKSVVTVVDAPHLYHLIKQPRGKTFRLMQEQIGCATSLIINKVDLITPQELDELILLVKEWNAYADVQFSVFCQVNPNFADTQDLHRMKSEAGDHPNSKEHNGNEHTFDQEEHSHTNHHHEAHNHGNQAVHHHSHDHVMALTYYFDHPVDSHKLEHLLAHLPKEVFRAKGIVEFADTNGRHMFQYAYREIQFLNIRPQGEVPNVAVFIGEHFSREDLENQLRLL